MMVNLYYNDLEMIYICLMISYACICVNIRGMNFDATCKTNVNGDTRANFE